MSNLKFEKEGKRRWNGDQIKGCENEKKDKWRETQ